MSNISNPSYPPGYPGYRAIAEKGEADRLMRLSNLRDSIYIIMASKRADAIDLKPGSLPEGFNSIRGVERKGQDIFVRKEIVDRYRGGRIVTLNLMSFCYDAAYIVYHALAFQENGMGFPPDFGVPHYMLDLDYFDREHPIVKSKEEVLCR